MNPFFSVRFRLFALCLSLLAIMGGANLLLGQIIREREPQQLEQQAQYNLMNTIHNARHAINTYRHERSLLDTASVLRNPALEGEARAKLEKARDEMETVLGEMEKFDSASVLVVRSALQDFPGHLEDAVMAINGGDIASANMHFREVNHLLDTVEKTLRLAVMREQLQAKNGVNW